MDSLTELLANTRTASFGIESREGVETPVVAMLGKNWMIYELRVVEQEGKFIKEVGGETLVVHPEYKILEVVSNEGRVLVQKEYSSL